MPYKDSDKQKAYQHDWYLKRSSTAVERIRQERRKRRKVIHSYKLERGCARCGYNRSAVALDAHHTGEKRFSICQAIQDCKPIELILEELERCELICANCHREEHHG